MRVLGLVPARGGSRGVPRKNIKMLGGRPLLAYTAESALTATRLARVVLSTEDQEIADVGRQVGLDVPFMRPAELAGDTTPTLDVVQHALTTLESAGERFDAVCLLQPTDPFRRAVDIDNCVALLMERAADCVISVHRVPDHYNPHWVWLNDDQGALRLATGARQPIPRRQDLPPAFHRSGSVYVTRRDVVFAGSLFGDRVVGYEMTADSSVNIDTPSDWAAAEALLLDRSRT